MDAKTQKIIDAVHAAYGAYMVAVETILAKPSPRALGEWHYTRNEFLCKSQKLDEKCWRRYVLHQSAKLEKG